MVLAMPRAKAWMINTRTPDWLYKSPRTTYLQTWHGTPLKKIGLDISNVKMLEQILKITKMALKRKPTVGLSSVT